jgi:hypothetical protein
MPENVVDSMFIKIGAIAKDFDKAYSRVEKKVDDAAKKLAINVNVDPKDLKSLEKELDRLKNRAQELRGNLLTIKPTVENPNAVKDLERELAKVEGRMKLVSAAADDLRERGKRLGEIGDRISSIGRTLTIGFTLPIIAAGTAVFALASRTGEYAEQLSNLSESSGLSTQRLQELKYIADNAGMSFEGITTAAGMVQQKLMGVEEDSGMAAKAFEQLGISIHDSNGNLRSMDDLFPELIAKLQGMENQTERNMLAAQIFGRGWRELAPILGMTAEEMEAARKKAEELGVVMSDEALKAAQELDDAIDELKQQFVGMGRDLAKELIPILKDDLIPALREHGIPLFKELLKVGLDILKWFSNLSPETQKFVLSLTAISIAAGPVLSFFGSLLKVAGSLYNVLTKLIQIPGIANILSRLVPMAAAAGPYALAVAAGVGIAYYGSGVGPAKRQASQRKQEADHMHQQLSATGMPNYRDIAGEMGLSQAYEAGTLTTQQKQQLLAEFRRRSAAWSASKKTIPAMAEIPKMVNNEDLQAANDLYKEQALRKKQEAEEKEALEKRNAALKKAHDEAVKLAKEAQKKQAAVMEAETRAYESAQATQLAIDVNMTKRQSANKKNSLDEQVEIAQKIYKADMQQAVNTYMQGWRELDKLAKQGEPIYWRWFDLLKSFESDKTRITQDFNDAVSAAENEADKKALESAKVTEESNITMWDKATEVLQDYSDRLVKFLYGETALRIQQLDRWREAERKAIEESISDAETRANALIMLDANYNLQRDEIFRDEKRRQDEQFTSFMDHLRQMTGFNSAEGAWRRAMEAGAQLAFSVPNFNQQMTMPQTVMNINSNTVMNQIAQSLQYANQQRNDANRRLGDINTKLESY